MHTRCRYKVDYYDYVYMVIVQLHDDSGISLQSEDAYMRDTYVLCEKYVSNKLCYVYADQC
jgi:hypothetical protein